MHEYAITKELFNRLFEIAQKEDVEGIEKATISVGEFSGYEPESIDYFFDELKIKSTKLQDTRLSFERSLDSDVKILSYTLSEKGDKDAMLSLKAKNDDIAKKVRETLEAKGIFCINLMGSPGSGKTTLIEQLSRYLQPLYVIQGDLKSGVDSEKMKAKGISSYQINTHSGCHLNAKMVHDAVNKFEIEEGAYLIVENVGNLVCPAGVKIGQHINILASATTEGFDKPEKYPLIFKDSSAIIITKSDLKEIVGFDQERYQKVIEENIGTRQIFNTNKNEDDSFSSLARFLQEKKPF